MTLPKPTPLPRLEDEQPGLARAYPAARESIPVGEIVSGEEATASLAVVEAIVGAVHPV